MIRKRDWYAMQEDLGCLGCYYADRSAIGKRPCCTHYRGPLPRSNVEGTSTPSTAAPRCKRFRALPDAPAPIPVVLP